MPKCCWFEGSFDLVSVGSLCSWPHIWNDKLCRWDLSVTNCAPPYQRERFPWFTTDIRFGLQGVAWNPWFQESLYFAIFIIVSEASIENVSCLCPSVEIVALERVDFGSRKMLRVSLLLVSSMGHLFRRTTRGMAHQSHKHFSCHGQVFNCLSGTVSTSLFRTFSCTSLMIKRNLFFSILIAHLWTYGKCNCKTAL